MACGRSSFVLVSRRTSGATRPPISLRNSMSSEKKNGSATLLSSDANHSYMPLKAIPGPRPSIPFIGTGWQYFPGSRYNLSNIHEACVDKYMRYGAVVKEEFQWRKPIVHLFNPDDFEYVFRYQGPQPLRPISEFLKHYRASNPDKYDTPGLANSVGQEWQRLRKALAPVLLQLNSLDGLIGDMNSICDDLVTLLRVNRRTCSARIDNLQEFVYRFALESVYMMSLETRLGCLAPDLKPDTPAYAMIDSVQLMFEAFQDLFYGLPVWKIFQTPAYKKLDKAESTMYEATSKRIQEEIEKLRQEGGKMPEGKPSVLQRLIRSKELTDKEIRVTVIDFLSGGIFTVSNAFSFLVYHISRNQDVQAKLHKELMEVMPDGVITSERLGRLPYLKACVKESFRLTPTIPIVARILPDDIAVAGYHIPAGVPIFCNFTVPCRQAQRFPQPDKFLPDRWLRKISRPNPFTLVPFGFGHRMCVGRRFAELEMHSALAKLVYHFKLESTGQEVKCKQAFIVVPSHPVSVIFKDRSSPVSA